MTPLALQVKAREADLYRELGLHDEFDNACHDIAEALGCYEPRFPTSVNWHDLERQLGWRR